MTRIYKLKNSPSVQNSDLHIFLSRIKQIASVKPPALVQTLWNSLKGDISLRLWSAKPPCQSHIMLTESSESQLTAVWPPLHSWRGGDYLKTATDDAAEFIIHGELSGWKMKRKDEHLKHHISDWEHDPTQLMHTCTFKAEWPKKRKTDGNHLHFYTEKLSRIKVAVNHQQFKHPIWGKEFV